MKEQDEFNLKVDFLKGFCQWLSNQGMEYETLYYGDDKDIRELIYHFLQEKTTVDEVVDVLNEQQATIEQLTKERKYWQKSASYWSREESKNDEIVYKQQATITALKEENEQLRQKLDFYLLDEFEWKEKYGD